jgi:hypothetical protein
MNMHFEMRNSGIKHPKVNQSALSQGSQSEESKDYSRAESFELYRRPRKDSGTDPYDGMILTHFFKE